MASKKISQLPLATQVDVDDIIPLVQAGVSKKTTVQDILGVSIYTALLTQSGASAPVPTVSINTLIGTPVWSIDSQGIFIATLAGGFPLGKTWISFLPEGSTTEAFVLHGFHTDANVVGYFAYNELWDLVNGASCWVKIEVYP